MAPQGESQAEAEYESDPEDAPLPSMRRREASDDEDGAGEGSDGGRRHVRKDLRSTVGSDGEFDGQGGAEVYDEEEEEEEEEEYYDEEEDELGEEEELLQQGLEEGEGRTGEREEVIDGEGGHEATTGKPESLREVQNSLQSVGDHQGLVEDEVEKTDVDGEGKKENEPYAVPTSGAFYMHDDRFQENGRGRHRRMFAGRKLWDPKDERAWVHDRFEEMNLQDADYDDERRKSTGQFRGRGSSRGRGGYMRGGRSHKYRDDGNNQNRPLRTVRGRGPRRYDSLKKSTREIPRSQRKDSPAKPEETTPDTTTGRQASQNANTQQDLTLHQKHFASSLNYASPPFYPSGSSNQDILIPKRDTQIRNVNKNNSYSVQVEDNAFTSQSNLLRGKAVIDPAGQGKLYMDDGLRSVAGKGLISPYSQSGFPASAIESSGSRVQGRGLAGNALLPSSQLAPSLGQVGRGSGQGQTQVVQQRPQNQPALRVSTQQLVQRPSSGNQASPPPPTDSSEVGGDDSPSGSNNSKTSLVAKGKTNNQGKERGSFLYNGAQVIGSTRGMGLAHGDQNFPGTPALLPVMQFGGQHPGGLGVPAVGMALPGYVAQPQIGFGNSEMTWVPVLAGAAGALGASYCSPYIALDGSYYAQPSGQLSSSTSISGRETSTNKPAGSLKPSQSPEVVNDELSQRQNKPRRYSEMNFGQ